MGQFLVQDGQAFLFIGDSITDCGRRGAEAPLGNGYVRMFTELVTARHPERQIRFINKGISGNRVTDLRERWADDVLIHKPDWLSIKIGINDLHSHLRRTDGAVSPALFRETYDAILRRTRASFPCQILLIDPFYISRDHSGATFRSQVLEALPQYLAVVREMVEKYQARHVRTHEIFRRQLEWRDADTFCPEPVHPSHTGHVVIAEAVYHSLYG